MGKGIAIVIAWPDTKCKQAGAWYDTLMSLVGINKEGYYKVGHAAIVLVEHKTGLARYFDFGRYHSPGGTGRVRSNFTDHDLEIQTTVQFDDNHHPTNLDELFHELNNNPSCHGDGFLRAGWIHGSYVNGVAMAEKMQERGFIPYGPFTTKGTNCSRFVKRVAVAASQSNKHKLKLNVQWTGSPSPIGNVKRVGEYRSIQPTS